MLYRYLKRTVSVVLAAALLLTVLPAYALAAETEEDGVSTEITEEVLPEESSSEESPTEEALPEEGPAEETLPEEGPAEETPPDEGPTEEPEVPPAVPSPDAPEDNHQEESDPSAGLYEAASGTCGDNLTWTLDEEGTLTVSGTGAMQDRVWNQNSNIKRAVLETGVTSIGNYAFYYCANMTSITIPETVTSIGNSAFYSCYNLTSVTIPKNVTSIGFEAFRYCGGLTSITIPEGVTSIGRRAFESCTGLTRVSIPESITSIEDYVFYRCTGLTSITIPKNVTSIKEYAFYECTGLTSVSIPENVTSIARCAFYNCTGLESVTIPKNVTSIAIPAFSGCTGLKTAGPIGDGNNYDYEFGWETDIPNNAFYGCSGLTSVTIPENFTSIGSCSFYGCTSLTSVTIPENVTSIGDDAFWRCSGLISVMIPESVASIGDYAFQDCTSLTSITIPEGVTSIEGRAFSGCTSLTSVTVPESATSFGAAVFSGCTGLKSAGPIGDGKEYNYKFGWKTAIPDNAFQSCDGLTSVMIPAGVTSIGDYAFRDCGSLTSITIPEGVTSIGTWAFRGCNNLTSITIPESVNSINADAFQYCTGLTSAGPIGSECSYQFGWKTTIPANAFRRCTSLTSVIIPEGVTSIGREAFYDCSSLSSITIPESVTFIDWSVFQNCTSLTSAGPTGSGCNYQFGWKTDIPANAFQSCSGLTSITIPEGITSIGSYAFGSCDNLTSITIPAGVNSIGVSAFSNCTSLTSITLPEGVTSIERSAFSGCSNLTSVTIPESVTSIGDWAFENHNADLCIYCYPGSYAETYADENEINHAILRKDGTDIYTWLTSNAFGGVAAGTEFLVRAGYSTLNAAQLKIDLPENITLSSIWLDGQRLTEGSYTRENDSLRVSVSELPDKSYHILYLYCAAAEAGTYNINGTLTMVNNAALSMGEVVVVAEDARISVPEKIGYVKGVIASGRSAPNSMVTLYMDDTAVGQIRVNDAGNWKISFDLASSVENESEHTIYAEIQLPDGKTTRTANASMTYSASDAYPYKVTMYNTSDHGPQETEFDYTDPEEVNRIHYYRFWPGRYPAFTFRVEFGGDPSPSTSVCIVTINTAGEETVIRAIYDPVSNTWVGTHNYNTFQEAPVWVYVRYSEDETVCCKDGNSSNKLPAEPILDPSGYVYEAVPSNRLPGVTATVSRQTDNGQPWNAANYDQVNPQITGVDGSYYWDVPAGNWKVSFTKEGYTPTETDWLPVPPPQTEINVPMVSTAAPEVQHAAVYADYAEITFSQYMDIDSVKTAITLNGSNAAVEALNAEDNGNGTQYATRFKAAADSLSGNVALAVNGALNYAGTAMRESYTRSFTVEVRPTAITAPKTIRMGMSARSGIGVRLTPNIPDRELTIENLTPAIIAVKETTVTTGGNGEAEIRVEALLPGTGYLRVTEPGSGLQTTVSVQVDATGPQPFVEASIDNKTLTYRVQNTPESMGSVNVILAAYDNQRMSTVVQLEGTNGTYTLPDAPADSYALFLVDAENWKPMGTKTVVSATGDAG